MMTVYVCVCVWVFSSVYRTFIKLDNTSHKENLNREKKS